jgi:hypothetical protein
MTKVLNVIKFDKKDKKNDNALPLFNELEVINGKNPNNLK